MIFCTFHIVALYCLELKLCVAVVESDWLTHRISFWAKKANVGYLVGMF